MTEDFPCCAPVTPTPQIPGPPRMNDGIVIASGNVPGSTPTPNREELAKERFEQWRDIHPGVLTWETFGASRKHEFYEDADAILSSNWLTSRLAVTRAEGAAEALEKAAMDIWLTPVAEWKRHGNRGIRENAEADASAWLEARAAEYRSAVTDEKETDRG